MSAPLRLVFLGTPEFAVPALRALARTRHTLTGVVSQPDRPRGRGRATEPTPVAAAARELGLALLQPEKVGDEAALAWLRERRPELGVVVAFGQFIPKGVRELPPRGLVNAHASLLPRWRGAAPIAWAIDAGDRRSGISVMQVAREMDAGDVCLVRELEIGAEETAGELALRLAELAAGALVAAVDEIAAGRAAFRPQDPSGVTLAPKLDRAFAKLDLAQPAERVLRRIRAATPRPGVDLVLAQAKKTLRVVRARLGPTHSGVASPGALRAEAGRLELACADSWLELAEVQLAGRRALPAAELLRGFRIAAGERAEAA
ncbi:MAG TPA: methionyl-tRNA formyltransferase [Myxococcota bacterium]|nr:methionyl-tRNA formyltransferase [Myxococcota bacterium]